MTSLTLRSVLETLPKGRLVELGRSFGVGLDVRGTREAHIDALDESHQLRLREVAGWMGRDELRRACERHGLFVRLCAEMPSLSWLDADRTKALEGIVNVVKEVLYDMKTTGETPPVALSEKKFSVSCVSGCLPGCTSAWRFRQPRRTPPSTSSF